VRLQRDGQAAEIVDAFEDDDPMDAGGSEDVAIETREGRWSEAVGEQMVAADALIGDTDVAGCWRGLEPGGEHVGPAVVAVGGGAVAVGDGVAEDGDGCG
jgi:hypothetical protein